MIVKIKTANHNEWLALRHQYIGGSDAAAVVGLNRFCSPYALWAEKTNRVPGFGGNLATEVGAYLEEFVAQKFAAETGKKVRRRNASFINSDYPFAIANIDREVVGEDAGLEIKTTDSLNMRHFANGEYPDNYYVQIVHYLAVTGKKRWYLAVLIGNKDFRCFVIERDEEEIAALMDEERSFWEHVKNDTPPPIDGENCTGETIKTIYAKSDDTVIDLYPHKGDIERYVSLSEQIKELERQRDEAANRIKVFLGDSGGGETDGYRILWRSQVKRTFDSKRFAADHPEMDLSGYYKEINMRPFKLTAI